MWDDSSLESFILQQLIRVQLVVPMLMASGGCRARSGGMGGKIKFKNTNKDQLAHLMDSTTCKNKWETINKYTVVSSH